MLAEFRRNKSGLAAIELALFAMFLAVATANLVDTSVYIYQRMQVDNAAQLGAMAVLKACDIDHVPVTIKCPGLNATVTSAIQATSLGDKVSLKGGAPTEGYYCVSSANALQLVSAVDDKPSDCSSVGMKDLTPGDYVEVSVTFSYEPMFGNLSVANFLPAEITRSALMRVA